MAELFQRDKSVITRHIGNIYSEGELLRESTSAKIAFVPETRDRAYEVTYYNLDVIISVGYRVKSLRGTQFRIWATQRLRDYIIKGVALNDERFTEDEIKVLKLIVEQFLAFAEAQAVAHVPMYMKDWIEHLKMVLTMNRKSILEDAGRISHQMALQKADEEYSKYKHILRVAEHLESIKELNEDLKHLQMLGKYAEIKTNKG